MPRVQVPLVETATWLGAFGCVVGFLAHDPGVRHPSAASDRGQRVAMYVAGCALFSLGLKLFLDADLGTDPLYSLVIGIVETLALPYVGVGVVVSAVTGGLLLPWSLWTRRLPPPMTLVTMGLVGYLVDLWNLVDLERLTTDALNPYPMMLAGLLLQAYASALIIMSGTGIRVPDLLAIAMRERWSLPFLAGKMGLEIAFILLAALVHGPIGVGTLAFLYLVAPFIPSFMWASRRLLRLPNHGMPRPARALRV